MPVITRFCGIKVMMYYDEHNPPHFHAEYNDHKALVDINDAKVIKGALPSSELKMVLGWAVLHRDELLDNWRLAKEGKPLNSIKPLM